MTGYIEEQTHAKKQEQKPQADLDGVRSKVHIFPFYGRALLG